MPDIKPLPSGTILLIRMLVQPLSDFLFRDKPHDYRLFARRPRAVQRHDVSSNTPYVVPFSIEKRPPAVRGFRGEWNI